MTIMKRILAASVSIALILGQGTPAYAAARQDPADTPSDLPPPSTPPGSANPVPPAPPPPPAVPNGGMGQVSANACVQYPTAQIQAIQMDGYQYNRLGFNTPYLATRYARSQSNMGPVMDLGPVAAAGAWAIRGFLWNFGLAPIIDGLAGHWEVRSDDLFVEGGQNHLQGMTLYHGGNLQNTYALVTGGDWRGATTEGSGGDLFWVKFGSRPNGYAVPLTHPSRGARSNMLWGDLPDSRDRVFRHTLLNRPGEHGAHPVGVPYPGRYWHVGGPQFSNGVIAIPIEYADPLGERTEIGSRIEFYDVGTNPENPMMIWSATLWRPAKTGAVALTRNAEGIWFLATYNNRTLSVYRSNGSDLASGWRSYPFREAIVGQDFPTTDVSRFPGRGSIDDNAGEYQSLNFLNGCDGAFYLVGLNHNMKGLPAPGAAEFADVFRWEYSSSAQKWQYTKVFKAEMGGYSHFNDASGLYVGQDGKVRIYTAAGFRPNEHLSFFEFREFVSH